MCDDNKDVNLSLKVVLNEEKTKLLYAVADHQFVDILLSFLTLPLGKIIKVLDKHYGDESPTIGSLSSLYHSLANLDTALFVTEDAKNTLLNPTSSSEADYERLKLDITDSPSAEYFFCSKCSDNRFRSVSVYYEKINGCCGCGGRMSKEVVVDKSPEAASSCGVFTKHTSSFIIFDDLHILPIETGLSEIVSFLGITDMDKAEKIKVDFGLSQIMNLLKASLTSPTPLSDVILNKTTQMKYSAMVKSQLMIADDENPNSRNFILKGLIQKSTGKLLCAKAEEDFVEFLFSLLNIPLGGAEHLVAGNTCMKAIDNLYRSTTDLIDDKYFETRDTKNRLMKPNVAHGCISKNYILPITEECLSADYNFYSDSDCIMWFTSLKFPKGQGSYLEGPRIYQVTDDLTVTPFCIGSILSSLCEQKISIYDVKEVELQIGLKEGLSILKASLTSTSALNDALLSQISNKQPKGEGLSMPKAADLTSTTALEDGLIKPVLEVHFHEEMDHEEIGVDEVSLTSNSTLSDDIANQTSKKRPKLDC